MVGLAAAAALARYLEALLYEVPPIDPATYVAVLSTVVAVKADPAIRPPSSATHVVAAGARGYVHERSRNLQSMATMRVHHVMRAEDVPGLPVPHDIAGYELVDGELVPVMPSKYQHAWLVLEVAASLRAHVRSADAGSVVPDVWCRMPLPSDPERLYAPDISFFTTERVNAEAGGGIFNEPPDLAVEIVSDTNERKPGDFQQRLRAYLDAGVRLLWVLYPDARSAMVLRPDGSVRMLRDTEVLDGEDVLPGFRLELGPLFSAMPEARPGG